MAQQSSRQTNVTKLAPFRFRAVGGDILVVSEYGDWMWLGPTDFESFRRGEITPSHPHYKEFYRNHLLSEALADETAIDVVRQRKFGQFSGPAVHTLVLADESGHKMPEVTLNRAIDVAFLSTHHHLEFRFCADGLGLPMDSIRVAAEYVRRKNQLAQKACTMVYVGTAALSEHDAIESLADLDIGFRVVMIDSVTNPESFQRRVEAVHKLQHERRTRGHVDTVLESVCIPGHHNVDKFSGWLDTLIESGFTTFFVHRDHHVNVGSVPTPDSTVSLREFLAIYLDSVRKFLSFSRDSAVILEKFAADAFARIISHKEPRHPVVRNPSTAAIGELAFGPGGEVFVSYEGWRASRLGVHQFQIGQLPHDGYHDLMSHPTVRALVVATTLEGQAGWVANAYLPFAGICPVRSYLEQGSISGRMPDSEQTHQIVGILDQLFGLIREASPATNQTIQSWIDRVI